MKHVFPDREIPYNVSTGFNSTETVAFRRPKIWAIVPEDIYILVSLIQFNEKIKNWEPKGFTCRLCKIFIQNLGFI